MTNTQHTPGPWRVDYTRNGTIEIVKENGMAIGQAWDIEISYDQAKINARLIATAPEMLSVLRFVQDEIAWGHDMRASAAVIDQIINKAEGTK